MTGFSISDLLWGTLNHFTDTLSHNSGDPRRGDARDFLNKMLGETYGRNTLEDVDVLTGIVFGNLDTYQVTSAQKAGLLTDFARPGSNTELQHAYKVYIPEIEPSPVPQGADDPVLWFYPNIFATDSVQRRGQLPVGTIVTVEYTDFENLIDPMIISVEGAISLAFPSVRAGGLPFKFKEAPPLPPRTTPTVPQNETIPADETRPAVHTANITSDNPAVLFIYPGSAWGGQPFVQERVKETPVRDDLIVIVAPDVKTPFEDLMASAEEALDGKTAGEYRLGGWSGGGHGLARAMRSGTTFSQVIYADPVATRLLELGVGNHPNAWMIYRPANWTGTLAHHGPKQEELAKQLSSELYTDDEFYDKAKDAGLPHPRHTAIMLKALDMLMK
jgi:hypothetical protein